MAMTVKELIIALLDENMDGEAVVSTSSGTVSIERVNYQNRYESQIVPVENLLTREEAKDEFEAEETAS